MTDHVGGCHCGALGFTFSTAVSPASWPARVCGCTFCSRHAPLYTSDPAGSVRFHHRDETRLVRYRFGLRTADFLLCRECGVYLGAVEEGRAVVNTNAFAERIALAAPSVMAYDGEVEAERSARHRARWTPVVS